MLTCLVQTWLSGNDQNFTYPRLDNIEFWSLTSWWWGRVVALLHPWSREREPATTASLRGEPRRQNLDLKTTLSQRTCPPCLDVQCAPVGNQVTFNGHSVEVVESFPYLGSLIHCTGDSAPEIKRRISITRDCMMVLDRNIWCSRISVDTKLRLYNSCILPIFLYVAETWAVTATPVKTFDALDQWCLRCILNIHWTEHITNNEVRSRTQQPLLSDAVRSRCLRFFGHICRADPSQDHSWALYASTTGLTKHWRRRLGRPRQTWLRTIENDLQPLNLGLATAQRRAQNRTAWQTFMEMAMLLTSSRWWWWDNIDQRLRPFAASARNNQVLDVGLLVVKIWLVPVVTTTSIILSSSKIQNGDILVPANPPERETKRERVRNNRTSI